MSNSAILKWINSGEYLVHIDQTRTDIMKGAASSRNESEIASVFERELYFLVRSNTGINLTYSSETPVDGLTHKFGSLQSRTSGHGRLDAVINNLIIEYKHHSKLKTKEQIVLAGTQVEDYLYALYRNENTKYKAILTDGLKLSYFSFVGEKVEHSTLSSIETKDVDTIIRAILFNSTKQFVPSNILRDFSINTNAPSISRDIASLLYRKLNNNPTAKTKMLYEEWQSLMHLSSEDNGKGNDIAKRRNDLSLIFGDTIDSPESEYKALYALQTTYSILVKLIACKIVDKLEYNDNATNYFDLSTISSSNLQKFFEKMEDGYSYRSSNILNFLEGDFFSWYSDKEQWSSEFWSLIITAIKCIDQYSAFSFNLSYEPIDIFKDLYMSIIPRSIRHSMGEYFTPEWLADCVISEAINNIDNKQAWKGIDPCCGSGIFVISLIKHIVGDTKINELSEFEKKEMQNTILSRVYGIDINPLSVLSARVGYYLALLPFGNLHDIEIPVYLGDSAIMPVKTTVDGINCYKYSVTNTKLPFDIILPVRFVKNQDFGIVMNQLQSCVKTDDASILYTVIENKLSEEEKLSKDITDGLKDFSEKLTYLHKNNWDGIWIRISTNFMLIARLSDFDLIVGNPPWVKWEHLPALYASKIKELCNIKHIFSNDGGQFGGTQLNICALISNVTATNWLKSSGMLAFLMPDSIMSQNSYEEFRNFYLDYENNKRLYLQKIDRWMAPLRPFRCDDKPITQDFNTYYFSSKPVDYRNGFSVRNITRERNTKDSIINNFSSFNSVKQFLQITEEKAVQLSNKSTAFSYVSNIFDFSIIIGKSDYLYRTGVEFTPQELFMLTGKNECSSKVHYFSSKKFALSKYQIDDEPREGWKLPTKYIYPILTGPNVEPFKGNINNNYCILPYEKNDTKNPVSSESLIRNFPDLFNYLVSHKDLIDQQSEKSKQMHRGNEFYALSKIGPYTFAKYIVAARDNSKFCATVVENTITPWGETKETICVKHTIIISQDKEGNFISKDEANYICGILNSTIVISYIQSSFKSNGYSLNKSNLYIPKYDSNNQLHGKIACLAEIAKQKGSDEIKKIQDELANIYIEMCKNKELKK